MKNSNESLYFVFGMKSEEKNYKVEMITVCKQNKFNGENAKLAKETLLAAGDYMNVNIYSIDQFYNAVETAAGEPNTKELKSNAEILATITMSMQPIEFRAPFVLVDSTGDLWNYYATNEQAKNAAIEKNETIEKREYYQKKQPYSVCTWPEFEAIQKAQNVTNPVEITKESYYELLEVLPPMNWHVDNNGLNVFFMSEFNTASYTNQLIKHNDKFYSKGVDYYDKKTWCKPEQIEAITANKVH